MPARAFHSRLPLLAGALFLASLLSCGREITGPGGGRPGAVLLDPQFATVRLGGTGQVLSIGDVVDFVEVRVLLERADGSPAVDTVVPFPPNVDSISLRFTIDLDPQAPPSGEPLSVTMKYVNAAGDTVFSGGPIEVVAKPPTSGNQESVRITVGYVGVGADAKSITISPIDYTGLRLDATAFSATVFDSSDAPLPLAPVAFTSTDSQRVSVDLRTGATTLLGARGTARIIAQTLTGQADTADVTITPVATSLLLISGGNQQVRQAEPFPQPVRVRAVAVDNIGVGGVVVEFNVLQGQGSVSQPSVTTDANGEAEVIWTAGDSAGAAILRASIFGTPTGVNVGGTQLSSAVTTLTFGTQPANIATAGTAIPAMTVVARDATGDTVPDFNANITLALTGGTAGANLLGTATVAANAGVAVFSGLTVDRGGTGYRLTANIPALPGVPPVQSTLFNAGAAPPASIVLVGGGGQTGLASTPLTDSIKVRVRDQFNFAIVGATVTFAVTAGGGSVAPLTAITDASGFAATRWTVGASGPQQMTATTAGLTPVTVSASIGGGGGGPPVLFLGLDTMGVAIGRTRQVPVLLTNPTPSPLTVTLTMRDTMATWTTGSVVIPATGNQALASITGLFEGDVWAVASSAAGTDSVLVSVDSAFAIIDGPANQYILVGDTMRTLVLIPEPAGVGGVTLTVQSTDSSVVLVAPGSGLGEPEEVCYNCYDLRAAPTLAGKILAPLAGTAVLTIAEGQVSAQLVVVAIAPGPAVPLTLDAPGLIGTGIAITPEPDGVTAYVYASQVAVGHEAGIEAYRGWSARYDDVVRLRSLTPAIASVDSIALLPRGYSSVTDLFVRALAPGVAQIEVTVGAVADTAEFTVYPGRLQVTASGGSFLDIGDVGQITAYAGADVGGFFTSGGETTADVSISVVSRSPAVVRPTFGQVRLAAGDGTVQMPVEALGAGTAWIVVSAPGYAEDSTLITVESVEISVSSVARTGVGLVDGSFEVIRSIGAPGLATLNLTVTSSDENVVRVLTPNLTIATNTSYADARLLGVGIGTATVTVSGPGITPYPVPYQVYPAVLSLNSYTFAQTFDPDSSQRSVTTFLSDGTYSQSAGDTITAIIRSTDPAVLYVTDSIITFQPGTSFITDGIFRAIGPGTAQFTVNAPGFAPDTSAVLTVRPPRTNFTATNLQIGRGLQTVTSVQRFSSTSVMVPFSVTVLGPLGVTVGAPADSFPIGAASRQVTVRSGNVVGGTDTVIVSAPGFTPDTVYVTVGDSRAQMYTYPSELDIGESFEFVQVRMAHASPFIAQQSRDTTKVVLVSRDPGVLTVATDTIRVDAGESFNFVYGVVTAQAPGTAWLVATPVGGGNADSVYIQVRTPKLLMSNYGELVMAMQETTYEFQYWVQRPFATGDSVWVRLTSTAPAILTVPDSVLIPADNDYAYFTITSGDTTGSAMIVASAPGFAPAAMASFVTRARFDLYLSDVAVGGREIVQVYRSNANNDVNPSTVDIPIQFVSLDSTIAKVIPDTATLPAGELYYYNLDSLAGVSVGTTAITVSDLRTTAFQRVLPGSTPARVRPASFELSGVTEVYGTVGLLTAFSEYLYVNGLVENVYAQLRSVGGKFAPSQDSILLSSYSSQYFGVRGITAGIDTLVITAPGFTPESLTVRIGQGILTMVTIPPPVIRDGDSVEVRLSLRNPDNESSQVAPGPLTFTLGSSGSVVTTLGAGPVVSVQADAGANQIIFYVKASGVGTGSAVVTHPDFAPFELRFTTRSP